MFCCAVTLEFGRMLPFVKSVSPLLLLNIDDRSCSEPVDLAILSCSESLMLIWPFYCSEPVDSAS